MVRLSLAVGLLAILAAGLGARAAEKVPLPKSAPPMQVMASMDDSGRIVLRMYYPEYRPRAQSVQGGGEGKQATSYETVIEEHTFHLDPKEVRVYDSRGKEIKTEELPALLKHETLALYTGAKFDPLQLRLIKEGTLVFVYLPPRAAASDKSSGQATNAPVPGLEGFLKKQGYVAVPLERLESGQLGVRARVGKKELFLGVDTGASVTCLDPLRVRRLNLQWDEYSRCDLTGLEIGGVKIGPLKVDSFDLKYTNSGQRTYHQSFIDGLLGADVLRPFSAVIDEAGAVLYLRKQEAKK